MSQERDEQLDAFLREAAELLPATGADGSHSNAALQLLTQLSEALPQEQPSEALRARLLTSAAQPGRLARFAVQVARLLDLSLERAKALLERIDDPAGWSTELPGVSFLWVDGGPSVADAVRGFVRVQAGLDFPEHEHFGEERVLIMQGAYRDGVTGKLWTAGEESVMVAGSAHGFSVPAGGPDLLKLAVIQRGLRVGPQTYTPR